MRLILFDIDGTLLRADGAAQRCFDQVFHKLFGVENCWGETSAHGKTDPLLIDEIARRTLSRGLTQSEYHLLCTAYAETLERELAKQNTISLLPGVRALLDLLSSRGEILLGLETGNLESTAWLKLKHAGIDHHFSVGGYGSDSSNRAEIVEAAIKRARVMMCDSSLEPAEVFVIGDAPQDVLAARAIGARVLAVATGIVSVEALRALRPDFVVNDLGDTPQVLDILLNSRG